MNAMTRKLLAIAVGLAVGALAAFGGWRLWLKPREINARKRYETVRDVASLYALQLTYKKRTGRYADGLDALLAIAQNRDAVKARLARNADLSTLTVVGDAEKFKIEANVLDEERTLVKIKGPLAPRVSAAPAVTPAAPPMNADGSPLDPGR